MPEKSLASGRQSVIDWVGSLLAVAGLITSLVLSMNVRSLQGTASDFKTLYASAWCFAHGLDAYRVDNINAVFQANHVVAPVDWYGHAAVYPPFTLALFAPLTAVPMVQAAYVWLVLSGLLMASAIVSLIGAARREFGLSWRWCLVIIAACAAGPLPSFALEMGNVSVAVTALCITVVFASSRMSLTVAAIGLAAALFLKPHIAIWVLLALLLSGDRLRSHGSALVLRAAGVSLVGLVGVVVWLGAQSMLLRQAMSYREIVWSETHSGSMSPMVREFLPGPSQITSLASVLAYRWRNASGVAAASWAACLVLALLLAAAAARMRTGRSTSEQRFLYLASWCGLGLIATYHRAHDEIILLLLVPWVVHRLRNSIKNLDAWAVFALYAAISWQPSREFFAWLGAVTGWRSLATMVFYRQSALAAILLEILLLALLYRTFRANKEDCFLARVDQDANLPAVTRA